MPVPVSVSQMALTLNQEFMSRVTAMLAFVSESILTEPISTQYHSQRAMFAQRVVASPSQVASQGGPIVVMGTNVVPATVYDEETKIATCSIADIDLEAQLRVQWNHLAGIDTPAAT